MTQLSPRAVDNPAWHDSPFHIAHLKRIANPDQPSFFNGHGLSPEDRDWLEERGYIACSTHNHPQSGGKHYVLTTKGTAALLIDATNGLKVR